MLRLRWIHGLLAVSLSAIASAQTTRVVGPSGFAQIRDALLVSQPGDTVLVQPGTYAHFDVTIPVTVRAAQPGTVDVAYDPAIAGPGCLNFSLCAAFQGPTRLAPPAGTTAHLIGLRFQPNTVPAVGGIVVRHRVQLTSGRVVFDQCELRANGATALLVQNAEAHLLGCVVEGLGPFDQTNGCVLQSSSMTAVSTSFVGGSAAGSGLQAGIGIVLTQSRLQASAISSQGGDHSFGGVGGVALSCDGTSQFDVSDSSFVAGVGVTGCVMAGSGVASSRAARSQVGQGPFCPVPIVTNVTGASRPMPIVVGSPFAVAATTGAFVPVAFFAALRLGTAVVANVRERVSLDLGSVFEVGVLAADGAGSAVASWNVPSDPQLVGLQLWVQALSGTAPPFSLSPPVGSILR